MARVILKDPKSPSVKKTHTPRSVRYKKYLTISVFFNVLITAALFYVLNKQKVDVLFFKLLNNLRRLI